MIFSTNASNKKALPFQPSVVPIEDSEGQLLRTYLETRRASSKVLTVVPLQFPYIDQILCIKGHSLGCVTCIKSANPTCCYESRSIGSVFRLAAPGRPSVGVAWRNLSAGGFPALSRPLDLLLPFIAFVYSVLNKIDYVY